MKAMLPILFGLGAASTEKTIYLKFPDSSQNELFSETVSNNDLSGKVSEYVIFFVSKICLLILYYL
jgi:hypothetical protein